MASALYNEGQHLMATQALNWATADIRVLLLKTGYTLDKDHRFVSSLTPASNEATISGYARQALAGMSITKVDASDRIVFDATDLAFGALATGETIIAGVVYLHNAADSAAPLICYADWTDVPTNGSTFTITWHADGVFYWQQ